MVNVPSVPEVITVNSETLQTQIRDLLPSQKGFGSELQATNVIVPIIDLTTAAEGSSIPSYLQTALAFGSQTAFNVNNTTTTVTTTPGFYRIIGTITGRGNSTTSTTQAQVIMDDGSTTKIVYGSETGNSALNSDVFSVFDFNMFADTGVSIKIKCGSSMRMVGSIRQIATGDGTLVNPNGFPL